MFAAEVDGPGLWWNLLTLLLVPALVLLNGLFVAAEFSLVSVRKTRVEELVGQGVSGARSVLQALGRLDDAIAATQLGVTLASIGLGFVGEPALAHLIQPLFEFLPDTWRWLTAHGIASFLAFAVITFMHVVFGELIPKTVALQLPDRVALWLTTPLMIFTRVTRPVVYTMKGTGNLLLRGVGCKPAGSAAMLHSVEELLLLIEDTEEAGILDAEQADLVENVFLLSDKQVKDCMVPRDRMATLELSTPEQQILDAVRSSAHTRMPVYECDPNNIVGIVNTKDLFYLFSLRGVVVLQDAIYPALFLRPEDSVSTALTLFRKAHRHMSLVRDEDGTIWGLITLEDILEEIVGELEDEHDHPRPRRPRRFRRPTARPGQ